MKIRAASYTILVSADEKLLFNVGRKVSVFDISEKKSVKLKTFDELRAPSDMALSSDEKMIAYKNTSGHIAIHDVETGELLSKSKGLSKEGNDLFFIDNNKKIISSEWGGNVFISEVESGHTEIIATLPIHSPNMVPISNGDFVVFGNDRQDQFARFYMLSLIDEISCTEICVIPNYGMETYSVAISGQIIFFAADDLRNQKNYILTFNYVTHEMSVCLCVDECAEYRGFMPINYGYFVYMCVRGDGQYLLLGFSDAIFIFDLFKKACVGMYKTMYVSSLHFISSEEKVIIGTWENIQIVDFKDLLFKE